MAPKIRSATLLARECTHVGRRTACVLHVRLFRGRESAHHQKECVASSTGRQECFPPDFWLIWWHLIMIAISRWCWWSPPARSRDLMSYRRACKRRDPTPTRKLKQEKEGEFSTTGRKRWWGWWEASPEWQHSFAPSSPFLAPFFPMQETREQHLIKWKNLWLQKTGLPLLSSSGCTSISPFDPLFHSVLSLCCLLRWQNNAPSNSMPPVLLSEEETVNQCFD